MGDRDVGGLGEARFQGLCRAEGISAEKARIDETGWDFFVDVPCAKSVAHGDLPLDLQPSSFCALIQVKSTDRTDRRRGVKLSNWRRLTLNYPIPAFYLIFEFDGELVPQRAYLVHVGEKWTASVLKALRELDPAQPDVLHKEELTLTWSEEDRLASVDAPTIVAAIRKHVGTEPAAYGEQWRRWKRELGYGNHVYTLQMIAEAPEGESVVEMMVDFAIGLRKQLPARVESFQDIRFGIPKDRPIWEQKDPVIELPDLQPTGQAHLCFKTDRHPGWNEIAVDFYSPGSIFPFIKPKWWKIRLESKLFDVVLSLREENARARFSFDFASEPVELRELANACELLRMIDHGGDEAMEVRLRLQNGAALPIQWETNRASITQSSALSEISDAARAAWTLARSFDLDPQLTVELDELLDQVSELKGCERLLQASPQMSVRWEGELPKDFDDDEAVIGVPLVSGARLGGEFFIVSAAIFGRAAVEGLPGTEWSRLTVAEPAGHTHRLERVQLEDVPAIDVEAMTDQVIEWLRANDIKVVLNE